MEPVSLSSLLAAEEESLRNTLRADEVIDRNRKQSLDRLNETFDHMLLRYNAANADDRVRQAAADCQAAAVRDMLGLLLAGTARKEISKRRMRTGAVIALLFAVIFCLVAALLVRKYYLYGCIAAAVAALCAFLSGRLWYGEREVRVHAGLDPDVVWRTLNKTVETMDRKTDEFLTQEQVWAADSGSGHSPDGCADGPPGRFSDGPGRGGADGGFFSRQVYIRNVLCGGCHHPRRTGDQRRQCFHQDLADQKHRYLQLDDRFYHFFCFRVPDERDHPQSPAECLSGGCG